MPNNDSASKIIAIRVSPKSQRIYVRSRKTPLIVVGLLYILPWALLCVLYFGFYSKSHSTSADGSVHSPKLVQEGPWGTLKCYEFITDPPAEFLTDDLFPAQPTEWQLGTISRDALNALFESSGMPADQRARILATAEMIPNQGWLLKPSDDDVLNMPPNSRKTIYQELAKIPFNQRQIDPFIFNPQQLDTWLDEAKLSPEIVANVRKLLYPHDHSLLLADAIPLMKTVPSPEDRRTLLNVLMRRATVMLKLQRGDHSDVSKLAGYWGAGGRQEIVRPMLESIQNSRDGMVIDVALLLPPFARDRLYMYPLPSSNPLALQRDCHWTAFNFFNNTPNDRLTNPANVKAEIVEHYTEVSDTPRLGDIAMLSTPENRAVHSCVYIANDFYFTKNGPSKISPWVLMPMAEIKNLFPAYETLNVKFFRMK